MKDRIIEGYLKDFVDAHNLQGVDEPKAFEHFINYCVVSREHPENFDFEGVSVGGPGDFALDGIAILVNDHLVNTREEVDFFKRSLRRLDVRYLFIQSKTADKFEMGDIGNFMFGVRAFFSSALTAANPQIVRLKELVDYIYGCSIDMDRAPVCELYYATTGKWTDDPTLLERIKSEKAALQATNLFSDIEFHALDAESIKTLYRELRRKVTREIVFDKHTILPGIQDVAEAYIGILPCTEYVKLISDSEGKLQRALFYDNVRDYQGNNSVNQEIEETLKSASYRDKFVLLNNGITIVADSISKVGSKFCLKDFQIVNGCQTSHVLFRNRDGLANSYVPIKIIVTTDQEVASSITKGTNRQTEVKVEAFESLNPFQKELEEFYSTFGKEKPIRLYYERRSRQYDSLPIQAHQIVTIPAQVACFVGMFLNEPHSTHRYYGELLDSSRTKMFLENHSPYPYYLSGYALTSVNSLIYKGELPNTPKRFRYHLLMLFRLLFEPSPLPYLNDKRKMDGYCSHLFGILANPTSARSAFQECAKILNDVLRHESFKAREADRLRAFTSALVELAEDRAKVSAAAASATAKVSAAEQTATTKRSVASVERQRGRVARFSDVKGYGFITPEGGQGDIFVHFSGVRGDGFRTLREGQTVEFTVLERARGPLAVDVEVVEGQRQ